MAVTNTKFRGYKIRTEPVVDAEEGTVYAWSVIIDGGVYDDGYAENETDAIECGKSCVRNREQAERIQGEDR